MGLNVAFDAEFPAYTCDGTKASVLLNLLGPAQPNISPRRPVALTCVIDRSGSMAGAKLDLVKRTLFFMLDTLKADDIFGLVVFDSRADEVFPACALTMANRERAMSAVEYIQAGSTTFLSGGLFAGIAQQETLKLPRPTVALEQLASFGPSEWEELKKKAEDSQNEPAPARCLLLFTDGQATHGPIKAAELVPQLQEKLKRSVGRDLILHSFGFGTDHDSGILEAIADAGAAGGLFHYIENEAAIAEAFSSALGGLFSTFARDIVVTITPRNGATVEAVSRQHSPANARHNLNEIKVGNIMYEGERNILIDLHLVPSTAPVAEQEVLDFIITYKDLADRPQEQALSVTLERCSEAPTAAPNQKVVDNRIRVEVASGIQAALESARTVSLASAREQLSSQLQRLSSAGPPSRVASTYLAEGAKVLEDMQTDKYLSTHLARRANVTSRSHSSQTHAGFFRGSTTVSYSTPYQRFLSGEAQAAVSNPKSSLNRSAPPNLGPSIEPQPRAERQPTYQPSSHVPAEPDALAATFKDLAALPHESEEDAAGPKTAWDDDDFSFGHDSATPADDKDSFEEWGMEPSPKP